MAVLKHRLSKKEFERLQLERCFTNFTSFPRERIEEYEGPDL
jgi:hypothetical protein